MKKLLFILLLIPVICQAQTPPPNFTNVAQRYQWIAGRFKDQLAGPAGTDTTFAWASGAWRISGSQFTDTSGAGQGHYIYYNNRWNLSSGAGESRFGYPGGDELAGENRYVDFNGFNFTLDNVGDFSLNTLLTSGSTTQLQVNSGFNALTALNNYTGRRSELYATGDSVFLRTHNSATTDDSTTVFRVGIGGARLQYKQTPPVTASLGGFKLQARREADGVLMDFTGTVGGGGIGQVVAGYGLANVNDSTLRVDTNLISTKANAFKLRDSLYAVLRPVKVTNANFASATEYDDPEFAAGVKIAIFMNQTNIWLDSAVHYIQTVDGIEFIISGFDAVNNDYTFYIWKVRDGVAGIGLPVNMTWPGDLEPEFSWRVRRRPDGTFYTTYDWTQVANSIVGTEYWVDPVGGNNANPGTFASPKKSIAWALEFGTGTALDIKLYPGWYTYNEAFNGVLINRSVKVTCPSGIAYVTTSDVTGAWSAVVGNPGAFESTYSGPAAIEIPVAIDTTNKDEFGTPIRLTPVASIAAVASTPGSVFANNTTGVFYVHTWDSRTPDGAVKVFFEKNAVRSVTAGISMYFENIWWMGGGSSGQALFSMTNNSTVRTTIVRRNCRVLYSHGNSTNVASTSDGSAVINYYDLYDQDCVYAYNGMDGNDFDFNSRGLEENCVGYYNGYSAVNDANNGSTAHGNTKVVRVNCTYKYNGGRNMHDIESVTSYNVNIVADSSRGVGGSDWSFGTSSPGSLNTTMYFFDAESEATKGWDVRTTEGHIFTYNTNIGSTTNNIVGTQNALTGYTFDPVPVVLSSEVNSTTSVRVRFSEAVTSGTTGWTIKINGVSQTPSAVSGSGTNTLTFTVTAVASSDVVTRSYNPSTGNCVDANGNEMISFNDNPVTIGI